MPDVYDVSATSCKLAWKPPDSDGGSPITGYVVERRTGSRWIQLKLKAEKPEYEVNDLLEDQRYEFRIIAENKAGQSQPGEPSKPVAAKNPWS